MDEQKPTTLVTLPEDGKEVEDKQVPFEDLISELRY